MSGVNLVELTRGTSPNTYVTLPDDRQFNIVISTGTGSGLLRYTKSVTAASLGTTAITYVIDSRNPAAGAPNVDRDLLMDLSVNSGRTLLTIVLRDLRDFPNEMIVSVYALRQTAEESGDAGTNVVANPPTESTDPTLDSIKIGSEDYRVVGQQQPPEPLTEQELLDVLPGSPLDGQVLTFDESSGTLIWTTPSTSSGGSTQTPQQDVSPVSNYREMYNALEEALFSGALTITYSGKTVTYRSTDEMIRIHRMLSRKLGIGTKSRTATITFKQRSYH